MAMKPIKNLFLLMKWWIYWYPFRLFIQGIPLRVAYMLADLIVPVQYRILGGKRRAIERGLTYMYNDKFTGDKKVAKNIVKDTLRNALYSTIEVLYYPKLSKKLCDTLIQIRGLENLDNALKKNRGVVLLHGHFGNAHMIMPAIGFRGYKLSQLGSRNPPQAIEGAFGSIFNSLRYKIYESKLRYKENLPVDFIYSDLSMREGFRRFSSNEVVSIGIDGREGSKSIEVDFLGRKALFFTGTMRLIMKAGPVVLPTFHLRNPDRSHTVVIDEPMEIVKTGSEYADIQVNIRNYIVILERYIYSHPELYARVFWIENMMFLPGARRT